MSHWDRLAPFEKILLAVFLFLAFLFLLLAVVSLGRDAFEDAHSSPVSVRSLSGRSESRELFQRWAKSVAGSEAESHLKIGSWSYLAAGLVA